MCFKFRIRSTFWELKELRELKELKTLVFFLEYSL